MSRMFVLVGIISGRRPISASEWPAQTSKFSWVGRVPSLGPSFDGVVVEVALVGHAAHALAGATRNEVGVCQPWIGIQQSKIVPSVRRVFAPRGYHASTTIHQSFRRVRWHALT